MQSHERACTVRVVLDITLPPAGVVASNGAIVGSGCRGSSGDHAALHWGAAHVTGLGGRCRQGKDSSGILTTPSWVLWCKCQ